VAVVSEPWSITAEDGSNVFSATILASHEDLLLLDMAGALYVATHESALQSHSDQRGAVVVSTSLGPR
jgi:hypothetical protein